VFLDVNFTLPHTYFHVKWQNMAMFLFRSCWTVIVLGFSRNWLETGIIIEWVLENVQRYCKYSRIMTFFYFWELLQSDYWKNFSDTENFPELCLFFYFLFVPLFFGIKCWTQLYIFPFFIILLFFAVFIWRSKYSGRWGPELFLFYTFCLFFNFWN